MSGGIEMRLLALHERLRNLERADRRAEASRLRRRIDKAELLYLRGSDSFTGAFMRLGKALRSLARTIRRGVAF